MLQVLCKSLIHLKGKLHLFFCFFNFTLRPTQTSVCWYIETLNHSLSFLLNTPAFTGPTFTICHRGSEHLLRAKWPFGRRNHVSPSWSVRLITHRWPWWVSNNSLAECSIPRADGGVKVKGLGVGGGGHLEGTADWIKNKQPASEGALLRCLTFGGIQRGNAKMPNVKETTFINSKSGCFAHCLCVLRFN